MKHKNLIKSYILYVIAAFGISMCIVANVGISSINAMLFASSIATGIKIGTVTIVFNFIFLAMYMIFTGFKHKGKYVRQLISILLFGILINFYTYNVLFPISDSIYINRLMAFVLGTIIAGITVGGIVYYNEITFPVEGVCVEIAEKSKFEFVHFRYAIDVICVSISIMISFANSLPLYIREGTIISMILLSMVMNVSKSLFEKKELLSLK